MLHLVFQLHVVHYNSDRYKSFAEAKDKPDGLAVLAFFYEVRGKTLTRLCFPSLQSPAPSLWPARLCASIRTGWRHRF